MARGRRGPDRDAGDEQVKLAKRAARAAREWREGGASRGGALGASRRSLQNAPWEWTGSAKPAKRGEGSAQGCPLLGVGQGGAPGPSEGSRQNARRNGAGMAGGFAGQGSGG
eukprot:1558234-Alexandrium_andersonii.AAC.1